MASLAATETEADSSRPPRHVAIIMDGNGRWAKQRGLPRSAGHRAGTENLRRTLRTAVELGVEILTIYAFSTENWSRPRREVSLLMRILEMVIDRELKELNENGVQIRHIGELDGIPERLQKKVIHACEHTKNNTRLILNVAFNYGGRDEIVHAVQNIMRDGVQPEDVTEELISSYLYTSDLPDPDLIIRTSGEYRLSNFLIWQGSYSEYYYTDVYWPDFDKSDFQAALEEYANRRRRFGKTDEQIDDEIHGEIHDASA
ncbi:MAG: isoprenyl transferase [Anaerolineae bacterium]|nr:isoprenyl transferase [Anaerolineae bacterium]MCA9890340.1 isoprenyl transferase [Anaerolineae bacterium]MCA9893262.1 isoprenyl transferase [Anaerolineae bacterium]MCB9461223.1 isoprenyl transferase [Anaerolineaceae bacterium]